MFPCAIVYIFRYKNNPGPFKTFNNNSLVNLVNYSFIRKANFINIMQRRRMNKIKFNNAQAIEK